MRVRVLDMIQAFEEFIAYDPGGTTGYARLTCNVKEKVICITQLGQFNTTTKFKEHLIDSPFRHDKFAVIYESFQLRTIEANLIPVKVIGALEWICTHNQIHAFSQTPSERYAAERWYKRDMDKFNSHAGSAVRHGVTFITKNIIKNPAVLIYNYKDLMANFLTN